MGKYDDDTNFDNAQKRADKMKKKLFKQDNWKAIMKTVDPPPMLEAAFETACVNAKLNPAETKWLKKYLLHCDEAVYGDDDVNELEEAAATGW